MLKDSTEEHAEALLKLMRWRLSARIKLVGSTALIEKDSGYLSGVSMIIQVPFI